MLEIALLDPSAIAPGSHVSPDDPLGERLPLWSGLPFLGLLLSIAILPLLAPSFWHHHFDKAVLFWGSLFLVPFGAGFPLEARHELATVLLTEYAPFLLVLWALFTVSGGILIRGTLRGTPGGNTATLLCGAFLASWIGTTGAAMLTIRPLLRANRDRRHKVHTVVFFIFLVANIGGSLTPLGDPPLFLGFLQGIPFFWTLRLLPLLLLAGGALLGIYYALDTRLYRGERASSERDATGERPAEPLRLEGGVNLPILLGIVGTTLLSGLWHPGRIRLAGAEVGIETLVQCGLYLGLGLLSLRLTPTEVRRENDFSWAPMREVAILFAGIFVTMIPVLEILKAGQEGSLAFLTEAVRTPARYFWVSGGLSSFLDNAPTYLTFLNTALGSQTYPYFSCPTPLDGICRLIDTRPEILTAIAAGSVFMGAETYIGNAPNLMVKSIAESQGVEMPTFFGYILKYGLVYLTPVFGLVSAVFF